MRAVLEAAAEKFGWGKSKPSTGTDLASRAASRRAATSRGGAEVAVDRPSGQVRVLRVVEAFDCGAVVNPEHLKNQIEGAMVMGLGGALFEAMEFENGKSTNARSVGVSRAAVQRYAGDRDGAGGSQGSAIGGSGRDADCGVGAGSGERDFPWQQACGYARCRWYPLVCGRNCPL